MTIDFWRMNVIPIGYVHCNLAKSKKNLIEYWTRVIVARP